MLTGASSCTLLVIPDTVPAIPVASLLIYPVAGVDSLLTGGQPHLWDLPPVVYSADYQLLLSDRVRPQAMLS